MSSSVVRLPFFLPFFRKLFNKERLIYLYQRLKFPSSGNYIKFTSWYEPDRSRRRPPVVVGSVRDEDGCTGLQVFCPHIEDQDGRHEVIPREACQQGPGTPPSPTNVESPTCQSVTLDSSGMSVSDFLFIVTPYTEKGKQSIKRKDSLVHNS